MSKFGIVNMSMVITEEKILSNIDKVQKLINPNSKKQIIELEEDSDFKDLVESIKTYLIEYPKKKNFPVGVYKAAYGLVEFATTQFEENTKKIEGLIKQREENIILSGVLKDTLETVKNREDGWKAEVLKNSSKFDDETITNLKVIGTTEDTDSTEYTDAVKKVKARINNLESNLHIEIDMERLEDSSKALSYIGIEVADALKLIPAPEEQLEAIAVQNAIDEKAKTTELAISKETETEETLEQLVNETLAETTTTSAVGTTAKATRKAKVAKAREVAGVVGSSTTTGVTAGTTNGVVGTTETASTETGATKVTASTIGATTGTTNVGETIGTQQTFETEQQQYTEETTFEAKPSLWQRFKNSKFVRAATYVFRIKVRIELPSNALPEGRGENR